MTTTAVDVKGVESRYVLQTYRRQPVVFERGEGMYLFDDRGRRYLDFLSGIGVAALGHAHPAIAKALADQAATLTHTSNLYFHPLQGQLAERLTRLTGMDRAFFCNSGTEAMEACLKFARRYWHAQGVAAKHCGCRICSAHKARFCSPSQMSTWTQQRPFWRVRSKQHVARLLPAGSSKHRFR